jgi:hypothetical protein
MLQPSSCCLDGIALGAMAVSDAGPWPIPLQRSVPRLLAVVALRAGIGLASLLTALTTFGLVATVLNVAGGVVLLYAAGLGLYLFTLRLEAVPGHLRLRSMFGSRSFRLRRGEVTRLWVQFSRRPLEARVAGLGVRFGEGQLGGESLVDVIALDEASTLLLVPVDGGRLAVASDSEASLIDALRMATR